MLIDSTDLGEWMQKTLDPDRATQAIRIAEGWLLSATRMDPWPDSSNVPEDLWAWDMELSALCYKNNPGSVTQRQVGGILTQWAPDDQARRQQILDAAKARYNQTGLPRGKFPCARRWPDEARPWGVGQVYF